MIAAGWPFATSNCLIAGEGLPPREICNQLSILWCLVATWLVPTCSSHADCSLLLVALPCKSARNSALLQFPDVQKSSSPTFGLRGVGMHGSPRGRRGGPGHCGEPTAAGLTMGAREDVCLLESQRTPSVPRPSGIPHFGERSVRKCPYEQEAWISEPSLCPFAVRFRTWQGVVGGGRVVALCPEPHPTDLFALGPSGVPRARRGRWDCCLALALDAKGICAAMGAGDEWPKAPRREFRCDVFAWKFRFAYDVVLFSPVGLNRNRSLLFWVCLFELVSPKITAA